MRTGKTTQENDILIKKKPALQEYSLFGCLVKPLDWI